ncbi:hypothetical protein [Defluviimonas sp. SAOS-178_SWC]|uniref:hypothetical protein n=1 Tax=Defluviimonas sp. SAOS-178_SWC TaxID=3121287 RepID=UPI0032217E3C
MLSLADSKSISAIVFTAATIAFTTPALSWSLFTSDDETFTLACEATLKRRLKSPSSYQRLEAIGPVFSTATFAKSRGWDFSDKKEADEMAANSDPRIAETLETARKLFDAHPGVIAELALRYEAKNGFGTSIANAAICTTRLRSEEPLGKVTESDVMINGYTDLEWSISQLR